MAEGILIPILLLPIQINSRVHLTIPVLLHNIRLIPQMVVIDLLAVGGPLVNMLDVVALVHLLLHGRVVPSALLLMLHTFLLHFQDILGPFVSKCPRSDRIEGFDVLLEQ